MLVRAKNGTLCRFDAERTELYPCVITKKILLILQETKWVREANRGIRGLGQWCACQSFFFNIDLVVRQLYIFTLDH